MASALGQRDLGQLLADHGPCKRGAEQIFSYLASIMTDGTMISSTHLVGQVEHVELRRAGLDGLLFEAVELVGLTDVATRR